MTTSRRSALAILGLAPTAPIAAADFGTDAAEPAHDDGRISFGVNSSKRTADALRRLADEIEGKRAFVSKCDLHSTVTHEDFLQHTLQIAFHMQERV